MAATFRVEGVPVPNYALLFTTVAVFAVALSALLSIRSASAAPFVVDNLGDSGTGSLREAIFAANAASGEDTITFSVSGTILLATEPPQIDDAAGVTIDGSGQTVTIDGNNTVRPFRVAVGAALDLKNVTVAHGSPNGILNQGSLTLTNVTVTGTKGIGLTSSGSMTATGSTFSDNVATGSAGAMFLSAGMNTITNSTIRDNEAGTLGAGILVFTNATLVMSDSTITGNKLNPTGSGGGGLSVSSPDATVTLNNTTVSNNSAESGAGLANQGHLTLNGSVVADNTAFSGGGIQNYTGGQLTMNDSTISGNKSTGEHGVGGGLSNNGTTNIANSTISGNEAVGVGGGISTGFGPLTLTSSRVLNNSANEGAGIDSADDMVTITNTTISGNEANIRAGGIYSQGTLIVTASTLSDNTTGGLGAGICCFGNMSITNSTLSGNSATFGTSQGGAIWHSGSTIEISSTTITGNAADDIGGIYTEQGPASVKNTIVANSTGGNCSGVIGNGANISTDNSCPFSKKNTDPMLEALAYNGGPTDTHALITGSPAINAGSGCASTDQRGASRVGACDLGAFEFGGSPPLTVTPTAIPGGSQTPTAVPTGSGSATVTATPTTTASGSATPTVTPTTAPTGTASPTPTFAVGIRGDGDCNQVITLADVIAGLSHSAGVRPGAPCSNRSDTDCDTDVQADDALRIVAHIGGVPMTPPAGCGPIGVAA